jgi:hypothetical protein
MSRPSLCVQLQQIEGVIHQSQLGGRAVLERLKRGSPVGIDGHEFTVEYNLRRCQLPNSLDAMRPLMAEFHLIPEGAARNVRGGSSAVESKIAHRGTPSASYS